jgi:signal transduction histidine kinase
LHRSDHFVQLLATWPCNSVTNQAAQDHLLPGRLNQAMNLRRWTTGIRSSTVLSATAALTLALFIGALTLRSQLRDSLYSSINDQALTRATGVAQLVGTGDFSPVLESNNALPGWVQVVDQQGRVVASTANIAQLKTPFAPIPVANEPTIRILSGLRIDSGERQSVASVGANYNGLRYMVLAAIPLDIADTADAKIARVLLLVFPALLLLSAFVVSMVVRRALRPVDEIRHQVSTISGSGLEKRVPIPPGEDELTRLAETMNSMLARLERSANQQRHFVADASHELRSPLASLRSQLEVTALDNPDPAWTATVNDMLIDHDRLERLVADLLLLTRTDSKEALVLEPIDLGYVVRRELARRAIPANQTRTFAAANILILGNEDALVRILRNLLDNAERHAKTSVRIEVEVVPDGAISVSVHDDGEGVPPGQEQQIFERFTRLDDARASDAGGSGLGLAIVSELVHAHNAAVVVDTASPGARFVVTFPNLAD